MTTNAAATSARSGEDAIRQVSGQQLETAIASARNSLLALQRPDGHFVFELEADATIPAEYVLMRHYLAELVDAVLEEKIARYLRRIQSDDGGWPLFRDGASNISASVKAYYALKMIGDVPDAPHMKKARAWILAQGGASHSNVFTRNLLALFGAIPWSGVPVMPVEIMLLPRWFPFHIDKISYWARTVLIPLTVLNALKPVARNPKGVGIAELFVTPPDQVRNWPKGPHQKFPWSQVFGGIDRVLTDLESMFRDVLMLQFGRGDDLINRELASELRALADAWSAPRTLVVLDAISQTRTNLEGNAAPALALESMLVTVASGRTL